MIHKFAEITGVTVEELKSRKRTPRVADARAMYYKLRREKSKWGLKRIGEDVNRKHSTVYAGIERMTGLIEVEDKAAVRMWGMVKDIEEEEVMKSDKTNNISLLMRTYFKNKDKLKELKYERTINSKSDGCVTSEPECYQVGDYEVSDFCEFCQKRHELYLEIKKLSHQNTGIMLKVRSLTKEKRKSKI